MVGDRNLDFGARQSGAELDLLYTAGESDSGLRLNTRMPPR
jgi:hypothetical protein